MTEGQPAGDVPSVVEPDVSKAQRIRLRRIKSVLHNESSVGFVILAVLIAAVVSARDAARRAVCRTCFVSTRAVVRTPSESNEAGSSGSQGAGRAAPGPTTGFASSKKKMGSCRRASKLSWKASLSPARLLTDLDSTNSISARGARPRRTRLAAVGRVTGVDPFLKTQRLSYKSAVTDPLRILFASLIEDRKYRPPQGSPVPLSPNRLRAIASEGKLSLGSASHT